MDEWIGLLDCNNFFVSCERLFRPDLKGKPVLVLSSNDGCVVARSKEVKDSGISMGVPFFKIKDTLKDIGAIAFSSNFTLYRDISRRVFEVMRSELNTIEQYSIDEAFFILKGDQRTLKHHIQYLKDRVEQVVGIPVSIGVAKSKTLAKIANDTAKKTTGLYVLTPELWEEKLPQQKLGDLWGVGYRTSETFKGHHLYTAADFLLVDPARVKQLFGVMGVRLQQELKGVPSLPVVTTLKNQKSLMSSRSFSAATTELEVLKDALAYHVRQVAADLRAATVKTGFLQVSIQTNRYGDFVLQGGFCKRFLPQPTNDTRVLLGHAQAMMEEVYQPGVPYNKAGVLVADFSPETQTQLSMFDTLSEPTSDSLMSVMDAINSKSKRDVLVLGTRLHACVWQSSKSALSPSYTTKWNSLATVKA